MRKEKRNSKQNSRDIMISHVAFSVHGRYFKSTSLESAIKGLKKDSGLEPDAIFVLPEGAKNVSVDMFGNISWYDAEAESEGYWLKPIPTALGTIWESAE